MHALYFSFFLLRNSWKTYSVYLRHPETFLTTYSHTWAVHWEPSVAPGRLHMMVVRMAMVINDFDGDDGNGAVATGKAGLSKEGNFFLGSYQHFLSPKPQILDSNWVWWSSFLSEGPKHLKLKICSQSLFPGISRQPAHKSSRQPAMRAPGNPQ